MDDEAHEVKIDINSVLDGIEDLPETLAQRSIKQSASHTGKKSSETAKANQSRALKGRVITKEARAKLRMKAVGRKASPETIAKMKIISTGRTHSEETKRKLSEKKKGVPYPHAFTEEHRCKIGNASRGVKRPPEFGAEIRERLSGKPKPKIQCPHCGLFGNVMVMPRWHFENCKLVDLIPKFEIAFKNPRSHNGKISINGTCIAHGIDRGPFQAWMKRTGRTL